MRLSLYGLSIDLLRWLTRRSSYAHFIFLLFIFIFKLNDILSIFSRYIRVFLTHPKIFNANCKLKCSLFVRYFTNIDRFL